MNTGFKNHIDMLVDKEGDKPSEADLAHIKKLLGKNTKEKWFNVSGLGYQKNWMYVIGVE